MLIPKDNKTLWVRLIKPNVKYSVHQNDGSGYMPPHRFDLKKAPNNTLYISKNKTTIEVPGISPHTGKELEYLWLDTPNTAIVYYGSTYDEEEAMTCGDGVVLITKDGLSKLPNVLPNTLVLLDSNFLIIRKVEKSPFHCPCAAKYDPAEVDAHEKIEMGYVFPKQEPIIIEGRATFSRPRYHSEDAAGFQPTFIQDPSLIFPWVSPDYSRHGWAACMPDSWEVHGKARPYADAVRINEPDGRYVVTQSSTKNRKAIIQAVVNDRELYGWYDSMDEHKFALSDQYIRWEHISGPGWNSVYAQNYAKLVKKLRDKRYLKLNVSVSEENSVSV